VTGSIWDWIGYLGITLAHTGTVNLSTRSTRVLLNLQQQTAHSGVQVSCLIGEPKRPYDKAILSENSILVMYPKP